MRKIASVVGAAIAASSWLGCNALLDLGAPSLDEGESAASSSSGEPMSAAETSSSASVGSATAGSGGAGGNDGAGGAGGAGGSASGGDPLCPPSGEGGQPPACGDPRWAQWAPAELPAYDVTAETALDKRTGLMWKRGAGGGQSWQKAIDQCNGLNYAGFTNWRLPTRIELASLVDYAKSEPALDATAFPSTPAKRFWSSTPLADNPAAGPLNDQCDGSKCAFAVNFKDGSSGPEQKTSSFNVRCVRRP